jgi:hypothetical protein
MRLLLQKFRNDILGVNVFAQGEGFIVKDMEMPLVESSSVFADG